jgi:hypothetical protein
MESLLILHIDTLIFVIQDYLKILVLISFYNENSEKNNLFKMGFIDCCYLKEDLLSCSIYQEV